MVTNFHGERERILLTRQNVRLALNLSSSEGVDFFKLRHDYAENAICTDEEKPTWDDLKQ